MGMILVKEERKIKFEFKQFKCHYFQFEDKKNSTRCYVGVYKLELKTIN